MFVAVIAVAFTARAADGDLARGQYLMNGMAHWTNAQTKAAIATGVRPDGRQMVRLMAFDWYKTMRDNDMNALMAYLRTPQPVKN